MDGQQGVVAIGFPGEQEEREHYGLVAACVRRVGSAVHLLLGAGFKARSLYYGTYWALMVEFVPCAAIL